MTKPSMVLAYATVPSQEWAKSWSKKLVEKHLAACIQVFPVSSTFSWEGQCSSSEEWVLLIKTTQDVYPQLEEMIKTHHPYETPCIFSLTPESVSASFAQWVHSSCRRSSP